MINHKLKFSRPASIWEEAILLGNGHTGASLWGGIGKERIHLNHDTFWAGTNESKIQKGDRRTLRKLRTLLLEGKYAEAEAFAEPHFYGLYTSPYLSMGEITFDYDVSGFRTEKYERALDLSKALYSSSLETDRGTFSIRGFDSYPDEVCVFLFNAEGESTFNGFIDYITPSTSRAEVKMEEKDGVCCIEADLTAPACYDGFMDRRPPLFDERQGINGYVRAEIFPVDGSVSIRNGRIHMDGVREFRLIIALNTDFISRDYRQKCRDDIGKASASKYESLYNRHIDDYGALYNRTSLSLSKSAMENERGTTDRIESYGRNEEDTGLIETLFNYGRYLLISSSRKNSQPANLQGVWNTFEAPPWWSNYTLNINTEMNYWGACRTGLESCAEPLYDFALRLKKTGEKTAKDLYSSESGWCTHHQTDIWAGTDIRGGTTDGPMEGHLEYSLWPFGGIWLSLMAWDHYEYTGDREFLESKVKPLLQGSISFIKDYLIELDTGEFTSCPSTSPENRFLLDGEKLALSTGSTMDLSLSSEAIQAYIRMGQVTDADEDLMEWSLSHIDRINPFRIGKFGQLQEWSADWDRPEDKHRHVSHLFSLFPGDDLMRHDNSHYRAAAEKTLEMRGLDATGWSTVWKICLFARLRKPEMIKQLFRNFLKLVTEGYTNGGQESIQFSGCGVYPNLLCAHPPFNIDGNLGMVGAITECIAQYCHDTLYILPAIPENWKEGSLKGIRFQYGLKADITWKNRRLASLNLYSPVDREISLVYNETETQIQLKKNKMFSFDSVLHYSAVCE